MQSGPKFKSMNKRKKGKDHIDALIRPGTTLHATLNFS